MRPVFAILGATATGKSALALNLARELGGEIINADALQVYRGFDIGTAKPTIEERARVRHHLVDILEPHEQYSAGEFVRRARLAIGEIESRGAQPLVVGGSGLYVRSLLEGISPLPTSDPGIRARLTERLDAEGLDSLRAELFELDPVTENRLSPGDTQRVMRALEVALATGKPLSAWIAEKPIGEDRLISVRIGLTLPRPILYDRVEQRVARMVRAGWVAEVDSLLRLGLETSVPAFTAIGYRQIARHVLGEWTLEEAVQKTVGATRRFAKRQATWFRREPDVHWFHALSVEQEPTQVVELLRGRIGGNAR
jgi:tRNA dimethylallyltransferase